MDYTLTSEELGKESLADLKEGHLTAPILLILDDIKNHD
jgi:geranylgeranyl pyrophosphate synthase